MRSAGLPLFLVSFLLAGCDVSMVKPSARLSGRLDRSTFPLVVPTLIEATADDGTVLQGEVDGYGAFELPLPLNQTWALRLSSENGAGYPIALARPGHFDRGVIVEGRAEAKLGVVWLPPRETPDVTRVFESDAARCVDGRLDDATPCAVIESLVSCADGATRPTDDPTALLLGVGALNELPGTAKGVRYAVASRVPPPILWECQQPTPP